MVGRGYFGIGIYHIKSKVNIGTLWRSAYILNAQYIFTVGRRYKDQSSDTCKAWRHIPLYHFSSFDEFYNTMPYNARLVAVETGGETLVDYSHHQRCIYLLGAEDHGLPEDVLRRCHEAIEIPMIRNNCFNVAVAGSIIMYDRLSKAKIT